MAETPRLDLPYLSASQAQKEVMHNISLDRLDLLVQCAVLDRNLTTPPSSPALGDAYIVAAGATGTWAGHANHLALWINSQWEFIAPLAGFTCWVTDETVLVYWSGTAWVIASGGGGSTTFLGLSDTPDSYSGQAGKAVLVNAGGTALEFGSSSGGAPVDATYIVSSANGTLTAERILTNSASVTWNTGTAGQVSADIPAGGVSLAQLAPLPFPALLGRGNPPTGPVEAVTVGAGLQLVSGTLSLVTAPGASDFLSLTDTPDSYSGQAGKAVLVNAGATALEFGTVSGGGGAPTDAEYIVGSASTPLTQERVLTGTPTVSWDLTTPGQAKAVVPDASLTEAKLALSDVTTANASTTAHGLLRKLSGTATQYLDGTGAWSTPAGGGGGLDTEGVQDVVGAMLTDSATIDFTYTDAAGTATADVKNGSLATTKLGPISGKNIIANASTGFVTPTEIPVGAEFDFISSQLRVKDASVVEAKLSFSDNTTLNVNTTRHGLVPKAPNIVTQFLDGTGAWSTPAAGGATTFLALTDTPDVYTANALKILQVNAAATATEFGPVLGTMATQAASAVAITGGAISIGGHAPTGVLDVQGNVDVGGGLYTGLRLWPVAPAGAAAVQSIRIEPITGAASGTVGSRGITVLDPPASSGSAYGIESSISVGTGRYNIIAGGTAQNYFAGNVGIASPTPSYPLDVAGNVRVVGNVGINQAPANNKLDLLYARSAGSGIVVRTDADTGAGAAVLFLNAALSTVGSITTTASATAFNTSSDVRLKHSIAPLTDSLDVLAALRPVRFRWNADDSVGHGFLAHELQQVVPDAVSGEPDAINDDGSVKPQQVDHSRLVVWLVAALQATMEQVAQLTARVASLEQQLGL